MTDDVRTYAEMAVGDEPTSVPPTPSGSTVDDSRPLGSGRRPRGWVRGYRLRLILWDLVAATACAATVYLFQPGSGSITRVVLVAVAPVLWILALGMVQTYSSAHLGTGSAEYRAIVQAALLVACTFGLLFFVSDVRVPRSLVLPLVPATLLGSLVVHWGMRRSLLSRRAAGSCLHDTVVVGRADSVAALIREIRTAPEAGMRIVAACVSGLDDPLHRDVTSVEGVPVFGPPESALAAVDAYAAEVVAVSSHPDLVGAPLRRLGWALAERKVDLVVAPGIVEVAGPRLSLRPAAGLSLLHVERPLGSGARVVAKRLADAVMTGCLLLVALPVLAVVALLVKLTSPGPVFYLQERVGTKGERFRMVKFRTMVSGADRMVATMTSGHDVNAVLFKDRADPRITQGRARPAQVLARRAAPAVQRPRRRDVAGRPASSAAARGRRLRARRGPAAARAPGDDRPLADLRPQRPQLGAVAAPRPLVRRQLDPRPRPPDPRPDGQGRHPTDTGAY